MLPTISRSELDIQPIVYSGNPYLNAEETAIVVALIRSVAPRVAIEIGCQRGLTARCILAHVPTIGTYIGIDVPTDHHCTLPGQDSQIPHVAGSDASNDPRFSILIRARGSLGLEPADLEPCDAIFIDGDHSEGAVRSDSMLARALLRQGGIIVWHDAGNQEVEVTEALDRLFEDGWPIKHVEGTWIAFMRWIGKS